MLHHALIKVAASQHAAVVKFYELALAPLGSANLKSFPNGFTGFGAQAPEYWIAKADVTPNTTVHVGFGAQDKAAVDAFYKAAIDAGGKDNGPPRRNNIEAGCMLPKEAL
ncbi:hypothetical protein NQ176_g7402 [Zarea fungicola]|uniref:Uncharacterized protein n=1 Tax=Zarea fungicola TaxID=93591 RepID=A0ACC1MYT3_9HYPO|nr:hypothetical protein NQ176_g7402 [Lecanicillium fungicola]